MDDGTSTQGKTSVTVSDTFARALHNYMKPLEGSFAYQVILEGHRDISRFYPMVKEVLPYRSLDGATILSSGCGSAGDLYACLGLGAAKVYGIDIDRRAAELGQLRFEGTPYAGRADVRSYDGSRLPYADDFFDVILSIHVIEHTQDYVGYLSDLFRVLKPGGIIFLDVPNRFYRIEQHTSIPLINLPSTSLRDSIVAVLTGPFFRSAWSTSTLEKLNALRGLRHPTPGQIIRAVADHGRKYGVKTRDAFFHTYGRPERTPYAEWLLHPWNVFAHKSTLRVIVAKS